MRLPPTRSSVKGDSSILRTPWPRSSATLLHRLRNFNWLSSTKCFWLAKFYTHPVSPRKGGASTTRCNRHVSLFHRKKLSCHRWVVTVHGLIILGHREPENLAASFLHAFSATFFVFLLVLLLFFWSVLDYHSWRARIGNRSNPFAFDVLIVPVHGSLEGRTPFGFLVLPLIGWVIEIPHSNINQN